jgi:hypothetical protein
LSLPAFHREKRWTAGGDLNRIRDLVRRARAELARPTDLPNGKCRPGERLMRRAAVEKAKDRLTSAKARLKNLESSTDYGSARRHWYDFLISSNAVFSVLEQGSKSFGKSETWFGRKKGERKGDPLLCYLHHARNADEHNVPSVTEIDRQKIVFVEDGNPVASIENMTGNTGTFRPASDQQEVSLKKVNELRIYPERAKLIPVRDRGDDYDPPSEHLGSPISDSAPTEVAKLMVQYIEQIIDEAESLIADGS